MSKQWWVKGDCAEACTPLGHNPDAYGDGLVVVYAATAEAASNNRQTWITPIANKDTSAAAQA